jgi:hypothetical protein
MSVFATTDAVGLLGKRLSDHKTPTALALRQLSVSESFGSDTILSVPDLGIEATLGPEGTVKCVHLHSGGHEGFREFPLALDGVSFQSLRESVRDLFGVPARKGEGAQGPWYEYVNGAVVVHFLFSRENDSLVLVTLSLA